MWCISHVFWSEKREDLNPKQPAKALFPKRLVAAYKRLYFEYRNKCHHIAHSTNNYDYHTRILQVYGMLFPNFFLWLSDSLLLMFSVRNLFLILLSVLSKKKPTKFIFSRKILMIFHAVKCLKEFQQRLWQDCTNVVKAVLIFTIPTPVHETKRLNK